MSIKVRDIDDEREYEFSSWKELAEILASWLNLEIVIDERSEQK